MKGKPRKFLEWEGAKHECHSVVAGRQSVVATVGVQKLEITFLGPCPKNEDGGAEVPAKLLRGSSRQPAREAGNRTEATHLAIFEDGTKVASHVCARPVGAEEAMTLGVRRPNTAASHTGRRGSVGNASAERRKDARSAGGPRYLLRKGIGFWRVLFDGMEGEIEDGRGIALVAYLLFNPPQGGLHATELASLVFCHVVVQEASLGADADSTRKLIQKQARAAMAVMQDPSASEMEKCEAKDELKTLAKALNVTRSDSEGNADRQVRAVRRAIERLIDKLRGATDREKRPHAALRAFGEHIDRYIWIPSSRYSGDRRARSRAQVAGRFTYERPEGVNWEE